MPMNTAKLLLLNVLGGSAPSFSPLDIPGLTLWLDASDSATLFQDSAGTTPALADNDPVGYWGDKSGNGRNATQGTVASKATLKLNIQNGRPVLRFASDFLAASLPATGQPFTVALVAKQNGTFTVALGGTVTNGWYITSNLGTAWAYAGLALDSGTNVSSVWAIVSAVLNGSSSSIKVDGKAVVAGAAGINTLSNVGIGAYYAGEGSVAALDVGEAIICAGAISDSQRRQLHDYFGAKWGIALTP